MSDPQLAVPSSGLTGSRMRSRWARALGLAALAACLVVAGLGQTVPSAVAVSTMVDLGDASTYAALSGASVGNTVSAAGAPHTTLRGNLGVKASSPPSGFPPGIVTGTVEVGTAAAIAAHDDLVTAYNDVAGRAGGTALAGALAGATIQPGLYTIAGAASNTGTVTLDGAGNPNAVFVFQVNGALAMAAASHVVLVNGAQASRVFWQVNGAGAIGAEASFAGTLMALDAVAVGHGTAFNGRALARNGALTLDDNQFYSALPVVSIAGGASVNTTDTTPTISGTTDIEAPAGISVTIAGQVLTTIPSDGAWSVTSAMLANGTYTVVGTVSDGAGNPGSGTQQLTVDTVLPIITLAGGASMTTNDPTPTVAGTSDVAAGTIVYVTVDSQMLTALVQPGGAWNVTPGALIDGTHTLSASVSDPAGNVGSDSQALTVDTSAPSVTIVGGANARTDDATPRLSGTAGVAPGTTVTLTLADETLHGVVQGDGTWSLISGGLADGPHRVLVEVSDAAGNLGSARQTLTVAVSSVAARTTIARNGSQKVKGLFLSIGTRVTAPAGGRIVASAGGIIRIKGVKKAVLLTRTTAKLKASQSRTLRLGLRGTKPAAKAAFTRLKAAVAAHRSATATITVRIVDAAGDTRELKRTVKLV